MSCRCWSMSPVERSNFIANRIIWVNVFGVVVVVACALGLLDQATAQGIVYANCVVVLWHFRPWGLHWKPPEEIPMARADWRCSVCKATSDDDCDPGLHG